MSSSLIQMFNAFVDFVQFDKKTDTYKPVDKKTDATHVLTATSWNTPDKHKPNSKGKLVMPEGFALAVCAMPLRLRKHRTPVVLTRPLPNKMEYRYRVDAPLGGKKTVLRRMINDTRAKKLLSKLKDITSDECDKLYLNIVRASYNKKNRKKF